MELGEQIATLREEKTLTQVELAEKAKISPSTLSQIESGRVPRPHVGTVRKIARALGVEPAELRKVDFDDLVERSKKFEDQKQQIEQEWYRGVKDLDDEGVKQAMKDLVEDGEEFSWEQRGQRIWMLALTLQSREIDAPESVKQIVESFAPAA